MDPLAPIAGLSLDRYADLSADVAVAHGDPLKIGEALGKAGVPAADWERAHAGWSARLADPVHGLPVAGQFEARYHAALDRLLGPPPDVPPEDFAAMLGEALLGGLPVMGQRRGVSPLAWSRISYRHRSALAAEPARLSSVLALAMSIAERRLSGAVPAGAPATGSPKDRAFEQDASVAAKAVGKAVVSGLDAFGSALDAVGKSIMGSKAGDRILVHWSDGNRYPGTVAQVGKGQYLVTMADGSQHWIPEAFVKPV
jgi:hypothetical protein